MLINLSPLVRYREFRLLYFGQFASFLGSMLTYVALPYQIFHLTHSSLAVGMVGVVQLVPLLFTGLLGGALADTLDRRKLLISSELLLAGSASLLAWNSAVAHPQIWLIYVVAGFASAVNGLHRPAMEAMTPRLVAPEDIPGLGALNSLKGTVAMIAGPAIGGVLIATSGLATTYWVDALSFGVSLLALACMKPLPRGERAPAFGISSIVEGIQYAGSRQELIGTYVVDFVAMIFGMPMALFPAVAEGLGGPRTLGLLYAAPSVGAFLATLFSGWTRKIQRHGAAVAWSALVWGLAITAFGFTRNLWLSLAFLAVAGGADMFSGVFRLTIWNTTIPDHMRGRLAGIEMLSYTSGPLLGNAESGLVAALSNTQVSIVSGGILCVAGVIFCAWRLPRFWKYRAGGSPAAPDGGSA